MSGFHVIFNVHTEPSLYRISGARPTFDFLLRHAVRASLVLEPWQWRWSSAPHYLRGEDGPVLVNQLALAEMKIRPVA